MMRLAPRLFVCTNRAFCECRPPPEARALVANMSAPTARTAAATSNSLKGFMMYPPSVSFRRKIRSLPDVADGRSRARDALRCGLSRVTHEDLLALGTLRGAVMHPL